MTLILENIQEQWLLFLLAFIALFLSRLSCWYARKMFDYNGARIFIIVALVFLITGSALLISSISLSLQKMQVESRSTWDAEETEIVTIETREIKSGFFSFIGIGHNDTQYIIISKKDSDIFYSKPLKYNPEALLGDTITVYVNPVNHERYYVETGELE